MATHCTITCFRFCSRQIDGVECGLFSIHTAWVDHFTCGTSICYSVLEKVRVTVCVTVRVMSDDDDDDDERKGEGETRCWLIACSSRKAPKGAIRLNVPIRRTNLYQQYYMPSQHIYCGRVWNLIQDCDEQSSD